MVKNAIRIYDVLWELKAGMTAAEIAGSTKLSGLEIGDAVNLGVSLKWWEIEGDRLHLRLANGGRMFPEEDENGNPDAGSYIPPSGEIPKLCQEFRDDSYAKHNRTPYLPRPGEYKIPGAKNAKEGDT